MKRGNIIEGATKMRLMCGIFYIDTCTIKHSWVYNEYLYPLDSEVAIFLEDLDDVIASESSDLHWLEYYVNGEWLPRQM